ncbi:hypothetical protein KW869_25800 [Pseudomonas urmiensis]|jgi:hypothetical protein|uniref:Uncharacterized protein n=1 Tax=Pseudomonas urmiensis TaxID=2745493 RepID=A0ABW8P494_9PSED
MRIYFSNDPDFTTSDWYHDIVTGSTEYNVKQASGGKGANYFRLYKVPSGCEFRLRSYMADKLITNSTLIRATNFETTTGVIDYFSLLMHPKRAFAPGVFKLHDYLFLVEPEYNIHKVEVTFNI